jgi:hypothetical protein
VKDIIVEFSGWVRIIPENAKFINISTINEKGDIPPIDGLQWLAMSEEERGEYILENFTDAQRDSDHRHYHKIDVFVD